MKILLVNHHLGGLLITKRRPPLGLLYIASYLREQSHDVSILDLFPEDDGNINHYRKLIVDEIQSEGSEVVGVSCFTSLHFPVCVDICHWIKEINTKIPLIMGGFHPSMFAKEILQKCPEIDFIVLGEGEIQFALIINSIKENDPIGLSQIQSIGYRNTSGEVIVNPRKSYVENLDELPMPAWDLINLPDYYADHSGWFNPKNHVIRVSIQISSSRGCPFNCSFCGLHNSMGRTYRRRSPCSVVDEIELLYRKYGQKYFGFVDDNFSLNKEHVIGICKEIVNRGLDIQFDLVSGFNINHIDEDIISAMADAGFVYAKIAIEHGNDDIRNRIIGKKLSREKIREAVKLLKKYHIRSHGMVIMGFPEDTNRTLQDSYDFIKELKLDKVTVANLIPMPGCRIFEQILHDRDKLLLRKLDMDSLWAGDFGLDPANPNLMYVKPYEMTEQDLSHYRKLFDDLSNQPVN